jgi:hypothetical protein
VGQGARPPSRPRRLTITPLMPYSEQYRRSHRQVAVPRFGGGSGLTAAPPVTARCASAVNTCRPRHEGGTDRA